MYLSIFPYQHISSLTFRFLPFTNQTNFVYFKESALCGTNIGMQIGRNELELLLSGPPGKVPCGRRHGVIMHEILHELGNYTNKAR